MYVLTEKEAANVKGYREQMSLMEQLISAACSAIIASRELPGEYEINFEKDGRVVLMSKKEQEGEK